MKTMIRGAAALLLSLLLLAAPRAEAQSYELSPDSKIWVEGTSNRSDWTVYANAISAEAELEASRIQTLKISIPTAEMKSEKSTIMDRLMHDALKAGEHPTITYELTEALPEAGTLVTKGLLTVAGVAREIEMVVAVGEADAGVRYTGSHPLKMSDYEMQPPTAMFGALRTADDVTVHFDVQLVPAR